MKATIFNAVNKRQESPIITVQELQICNFFTFRNEKISARSTLGCTNPTPRTLSDGDPGESSQYTPGSPEKRGGRTTHRGSRPVGHDVDSCTADDPGTPGSVCLQGVPHSDVARSRDE